MKLQRLFLFLLLLTSMPSAWSYQLIEGVINDSKIYPGTTHKYIISVPEGYDGKSEACLYVGLDGILYNAPEVMDSLIAHGKMPMTIGVYFQPGVIYDKDGEVVRYNRSNEYDAVDQRLACFIAEELLPIALQNKTADGFELIISADPNDHAISGASSGGIGAFVAAFTRPDLFRRVYTTCGTYVSMRGGDQLPAIVRKTVPQPLRLYIHDGSQDAWNPLFGHWFEQNQLMASALEFAGYDLKCTWDEGNHSIRNGARLFPKVMEWLWRDYPEKIKTGESKNDMIQKVIPTESEWQLTEEPLGESAPRTMIAFPNHHYLIETLPNTQWLTATTLLEPNANKTNKTNSKESTEWEEVKGGEDEEEIISIGANNYIKANDTQKAYLLHDTYFNEGDIIGMSFDSDGNLYVAIQMGIQIADQNGRVRVIIPYPNGLIPDEFSFEEDMLKIKTAKGIFKMKVNAQGVNPQSKPIEVKSQGQA